MSRALLVSAAFGSLALAAALAARAFFLIVEVDGASMEPALRHGDRVLVLRRWPGRLLRRGRIALVAPARDPETGREIHFIKRIVALAGDRLETSVTALRPAMRDRHARFYDEQGLRSWRIPPGHVFVQGDSAGSDSRAWGPVPFSALRGVVVARLRPRPATPEGAP